MLLQSVPIDYQKLGFKQSPDWEKITRQGWGNIYISFCTFRNFWVHTEYPQEAPISRFPSVNNYSGLIHFQIAFFIWEVSTQVSTQYQEKGQCAFQGSLWATSHITARQFPLYSFKENSGLLPHHFSSQTSLTLCQSAVNHLSRDTFKNQVRALHIAQDNWIEDSTWNSSKARDKQ